MIKSFIFNLFLNYFSRENYYKMLLSKIEDQFTKNINYSIVKNIDFNLNIVFLIKTIEDKGFSKSLF